MRLIDAYSLSSGTEIREPFLYELFFPLPFEKYITIQNSSGMEAKNYDYWQDVIDLIFPFLEEKNIKIILIGDEKAKPLVNCYDLRGKTSYHQTCYIISNSLCHLTNDSFSAHVAGSYKIPLVALYGSTTVKNHGPAFYNAEKTFLIESHRNEKVASCQPQERPKTINLIKTEDVANSCLQALSIKEKVKQETIFIGNKYGEPVLEYVPNFFLKPNDFQGQTIICRADYELNEEFLFQTLANRPLIVILGQQKINLKVLKNLSANIQELHFNVDLNFDEQYLQEAIDSKLNFNLFTEDYENYKEICFKFIDYKPVILPPKPDIEKVKNVFDLYKDRDIFYKSYRFILAEGKIYQSRFGLKNGKNLSVLRPSYQKAKNELDFLEDCDYNSLYLLENGQ